MKDYNTDEYYLLWAEEKGLISLSEDDRIQAETMIDIRSSYEKRNIRANKKTRGFITVSNRR